MQLPDKMVEYLETVRQQIRWKKAQAPVLEEIRNHLSDQKDALIKDGIDSHVRDPMVHIYRFQFRLFALRPVNVAINLLWRTILTNKYVLDRVIAFNISYRWVGGG